jgi:hypothetical protein
MSTQYLPTNALLSRSRLLRSWGRTTLLVIGIAGCGGFLSQVAAHPSQHRLRPHQKSVASTPHRRGKRPYPDYWNMSLDGIQLWDRAFSNNLLNHMDHQELRTYAALSGAQVPDASAMFPDVGVMLVWEPTSMGVTVVHETPREPWNGDKSPEEYGLDAGERLSISRDNWLQYVASCRTIAGLLGADNVPYPTQPYLQREPRVEFGSLHEISPGQYAYSSDSLGNVEVRDATMGRDGFNTPFVMQRAQVANWSTDRLAQAFLSPLYLQSPACGMKQFHRDRVFQTASDRGNSEAGDYDRLAIVGTGSTSRSRGANARLAAQVYHASLHRAYHEMGLE